MKVYIVCEGWYTDSHVEAVFSTMEQARRYVLEHTQRYEGYSISAAKVLEDYPTYDGHLFFVSCINGVWNVKDADTWYSIVPPDMRINFGDGSYHNYICANDEQTALSIAKVDYDYLRANPTD